MPSSSPWLPYFLHSLRISHVTIFQIDFFSEILQSARYETKLKQWNMNTTLHIDIETDVFRYFIWPRIISSLLLYGLLSSRYYTFHMLGVSHWLTCQNFKVPYFFLQLPHRQKYNSLLSPDYHTCTLQKCLAEIGWKLWEQNFKILTSQILQRTQNGPKRNSNEREKCLTDMPHNTESHKFSSVSLYDISFPIYSII